MSLDERIKKSYRIGFLKGTLVGLPWLLIVIMLGIFAFAMFKPWAFPVMTGIVIAVLVINIINIIWSLLE